MAESKVAVVTVGLPAVGALARAAAGWLEHRPS